MQKGLWEGDGSRGPDMQPPRGSLPESPSWWTVLSEPWVWGRVVGVSLGITPPLS